MDINKIVKNKPIVSQSIKRPSIFFIPPISTLSLSLKAKLTNDMPTTLKSIVKPTAVLQKFGVPRKYISLDTSYKDMILIASYMVFEQPYYNKIMYKTIYIPTELQQFWLSAAIAIPSIPFKIIITGENNSPAAPILATKLIAHYHELSESDSIAWNKSLEDIKYDTITVCRCRWPSHFQSKQQGLRLLKNIEAKTEDSICIFIIDEEDCDIVPPLLSDEQFGIFIKVGLQQDIIKAKKSNYVKQVRSLLK